MAVKGSEHLTIGKVVSTLKKEFPDLTISKIRYFEEEKLIKPQRTKGGYRKFSKNDIERLRLALRLQKDRYLPLHVIKEKLDAWEEGETDSELTQTSKHKAAPAPRKAGNVKIEEAPRISGLSAAQVQKLEDFGLIEPKTTDQGRMLSETDQQIIRLAGNFLKFGIEPRHLKMYDSLTDREITMFGQIISPLLRQKGTEARRKTENHLTKLAELSQQMKIVLLKKAYQKHFSTRF